MTIVADAIATTLTEQEVTIKQADGDYLRRLTETSAYGFASKDLHTAWPDMAHVHVGNGILMTHTPSAVYKVTGYNIPDGLYELEALDDAYRLSRTEGEARQYDWELPEVMVPMANIPDLNITAAKSLASVGAAVAIINTGLTLEPYGYLMPNTPNEYLSKVFLYDPRYVTAALDAMNKPLATINERGMLLLQSGEYLALIMPIRRGS